MVPLTGMRGCVNIRKSRNLLTEQGADVVYSQFHVWQRGLGAVFPDADVARLVADEAAVAADVGLLPQTHRYRLLARAA